MTRISIFIVFVSALLLSQKPMAQSTSGSKFGPLAKAEAAYKYLQYADAAQFYTEALTKGYGEKEELMKKIAQCYWLLKKYTEAMEWYEKIEKEVGPNDVLINFRLGELKAIHRRYADAVKYLSRVKGMEERVNGFKNPIQFFRDSVDWKLSFLDINTGMFKEFSPLLIGEKLVWTSNEPRTVASKGIMGWDGFGYTRQLYLSSNTYARPISPEMYYAYPRVPPSYDEKKIAVNYAKSDNPLLQRTPIPTAVAQHNSLRINTPEELAGMRSVNYNVAHATASPVTGKIYFSANDQGKIVKGEVRDIKIAEGTLTDKGVTDINFLNLSGEDETVMHPAIHPQGHLLVYSSNRPGGKGAYDLYYVERLYDGTWSEPKALDNLNTWGNELFASFSPKGDLYFSSDGLPGLGGLDIFRAQWRSGNTTSSPEHLSFPVNSSYDDFGLTLSEEDTLGYFTSDRLGTDDIIGFDHRPKLVKIQGVVIDKNTKLRTADVKVDLFDKDPSGNLVLLETTKTDKNGNYVFNTPPNRNYQVKVYEPEVPAQSQTIDANTANVPTRKDLDIVTVGKTKPAVAEPIPSRNKFVSDSIYFIIYFDFDKYDLTPASILELNRVVNFLAENPGYSFRLLGHTDLKGEQKYNLDLSSNRVMAALNYLVGKGYPASQFPILYYGKNQPAVNALDEASSRMNRRVEFVLVPK